MAFQNMITRGLVALSCMHASDSEKLRLLAAYDSSEVVVEGSGMNGDDAFDCADAERLAGVHYDNVPCVETEMEATSHKLSACHSLYTVTAITFVRWLVCELA